MKWTTKLALALAAMAAAVNAQVAVKGTAATPQIRPRSLHIHHALNTRDLGRCPYGIWMHAGKHAPGSVAVTRAASTFILPFQDNELLLAKEDASHGGYQFAYPVDVYITPALYGEWTEVPNGRVWTLPIQSAGAKSLSLHFNKFDIPEVRLAFCG